MKGLFTLIFGAVIALSLAACDNETTTSTNTPNPAASQTNVAPEADEPEVVVCDDCGTITSITPIAVEGESSGVGAAIGAVIGGLAGSQVGEAGVEDVVGVGAIGELDDEQTRLHLEHLEVGRARIAEDVPDPRRRWTRKHLASAVPARG